MTMKKILLFILLSVFNTYYSQNLLLHYNYEVTNPMFNRTFDFPAVLLMDGKGQKMYSVLFGIADSEANSENNPGTLFLIEKGSYSYAIYKGQNNEHLISDEIGGKRYIFRDTFLPLKYELTGETKTEKNIKLTKATTEFRGRKYIIWFDASSKIKGGPWKFTNLPGIAYEIYDGDSLFRWTLQRIENVNMAAGNLVQPKEFAAPPLLYTEYPKLKYPTKAFIKDDTGKSGFQMVQQTRDGLEKVFEWED